MRYLQIFADKTSTDTVQVLLDGMVVDRITKLEFALTPNSLIEVKIRRLGEPELVVECCLDIDLGLPECELAEADGRARLRWENMLRMQHLTLHGSGWQHLVGCKWCRRRAIYGGNGLQIKPYEVE